MQAKSLFYITVTSLFISIISCKSSSKIDEKNQEVFSVIAATDSTKVLPEIELLTEKDKSQEVYRGSRKRIVDLINTSLFLKFDWENEKIIGKAVITAKPYFKDVNEVVLDAKSFKVSSVELKGEDKALEFKNNGSQITIQLPRYYQKSESFEITIHYQAQPSFADNVAENENGLFFKQGKPYPEHIWTQGEVANNSNWYPTIDSPNEKMSQEIFVTIAEDKMSLSNGYFLGTVFNNDGTKTDHWKLEQKHSPYLTMLFVGQFSMVKDTWRGKDLYYVVEPKYTNRAKEIFGRTPEMLSFYSDKLGVEYPWPKLGQVVTRDFTAGGMENTGAIVYYDAVYRDESVLLGKNYDDLVAHEIFHQWFGDLTTCESWANLSLNESFATYGEYLWLQEKEGNMVADYHLDKDLNNYLQESFGKMDPIVKFDYNTPDELFDNHRYAKGGRVLHMLRNYVGEEAFFESLKLFLTQNAYKNVEMAQLRMAFEEVTGEDLNWFFNQWFMSAGHPELSVNTRYENNEVIVDIRQEQNLETYPLYQIPLFVDIYDSGRISRKKIVVKNQQETFRFTAFSKPDLVDVDGDKILLGIIGDNKTNEELEYQYLKSYKFKTKQDALTRLFENKYTQIEKVIDKALNEEFWYFRFLALQNFEAISPELRPKYYIQIIDMVREDKHPQVQLEALNVLGKYFDTQNNELVYKQLLSSKYQHIQAKALMLYAQIKPAEGLDKAIEFDKTDKEILEQAVGFVYAARGSKGFDAFFIKKLDSEKDSDTFFPQYAEFLSNQKEEARILKGMNKLEGIARTNSSRVQRYLALDALKILQAKIKIKHNSYIELQNRLDALISDIVDQETDQTFKGYLFR